MTAAGTRAKPMTPYRKGMAAGEAHAVAFRAWRVLPLGERGPSPQAPANPYTVHRSCDAWSVGFRRAVALGS